MEALPSQLPRRGSRIALMMAAGLAGLGAGSLAVSVAGHSAPVAVSRTGIPLEPVELLPGQGLVNLQLGVRKKVWIPGVERVSVADPSVVEIALINQNVMALDPVSPGRTTLVAWTKSEQRLYVVSVKSSESLLKIGPTP